MKLLITLFLITLTSISLAFPYHVSEDVIADLKHYEEQYALSPSSNESIFELAMAYAYSGQVQEGLDQLNKLDVSYADVVIKKYTPLRTNEQDWKSSFKLGFAYYFKKERTTALGLFEESFNRNPENLWPLGYMALIHGKQDNIDEAIRLCKQALKIDKNAPGIHFLLADAYKRKKRYFKALKHILKVARLQGKK